MTAPSISRNPVQKLEDLLEDVWARVFEVQEKAGFNPERLPHARPSPNEFRAFLTFYNECTVTHRSSFGPPRSSQMLRSIARLSVNRRIRGRPEWRHTTG